MIGAIDVTKPTEIYIRRRWRLHRNVSHRLEGILRGLAHGICRFSVLYSEDCVKDMHSLFPCTSDSSTPRVGLTCLCIHNTDPSDHKPERNERRLQCLFACKCSLSAKYLDKHRPSTHF